MKRTYFPCRLLSVLLALVCLVGLLPTAAMAAGTSAPATITLADYTVNGMGFNSANLGFCRFHRIDFNYGGEVTTAFCSQHGMSMAAALAGHTWGRPQPVTDPTVTALMAYFYAHTNGDFTDQAQAMGLVQAWDEDHTWMMNAWVQSAVWRLEAGTLGNPVVACAEELIPIYNRLKGTSCTSIDDSMGDSTFRDFTQQVLELGEQGIWGECSVYEYDYTDAGTPHYWADYVQSVMVGRLNVAHEQYSLIVKKVDATNPGLTLPGARFRVTSGDGSFSREFLTGQDGSYTLNGLVAGTYTVTELEAPEGYQIDQAVRYVSLPGVERTVTVTFADTPVITGTGTIKKVDADNPARGLAGAVIRIEGVDNSFVGTYVTGAGGYLTDVPWDTMPIGSYTAQEVTPPAGYTLSPDASKVKQSFHWDGRSDVSLMFENDAKVKVQLIKLDDSGRPLPGAVFNIIKNGRLIGTEATKADGTVTVTDVTEGLYAFVEVSAPAPYACLTEPVIVHVDQADIISGGTVTVTAVDRELPSLRVVKYDRQSGQPMSGVTFEVFRNTVSLGRFQTDHNGEIILSHVEPGTYLVKEVSTDDEHVVDSAPQQIRLEAGQTETAQLVFFNSKKPGIYLIKVDGVTMKSLPNVRFEFALVGGSYRQEFVTDHNGEIDLSGLEPGAYQVWELEAPDGYLIDDAVRVVQINPDENANFVFTNTPKPSLRLIKTSSDGSRLAGVQFRIAKIEDGAHYLDRITDANGEINISGLEPGVYSVKETATVSDHVLNTKEYHVELFPGQTSTITVENQKRPNLTIRKTDKDTGDPVPGVTFTLRGADGPTITTEPTGADGTVRITNLLPGTYTVTEQSVPESYILDATPQTVTLFANREAQVEFQNYQRPTLKIAKVDVNGKPLTGAIFTVTTKAGVTIGDFPVGEDGTVTVSNVHLDEGYYLVQEKQAPAGYILDPAPHEVYLRPGKTTEISIENERKPGLTIYKVNSIVGDGIKGAKFEIWVSKDKDQNGTYRKLDGNYYYSDENGVIRLENLDTGWYKIVEIEPPAGYMLKGSAEQVVYVEHDASVEVTIENTPKSALVVRKTDAATGAPLANAWFRVRYLGGSSGSGGTVIGEFSTSSNGNIIITGLDAGTYVAEEISAPSGYVMDTAPQTAYISGKEQDCITLTFTNSKNGALLIKKMDSITGQPLSDVQFFVTNSDGKTLGNANGYFITDSAGTILISDITPGTTLIVKETRAKPGYVLDGTAQTVRIKSGETATLEFRNQPTGSLLIRKVCAVNTSATLANAEFKVAYADGSVVGDSNGVFRSDEKGEVLISGLAPGKSVVVTETRAPAGFIIDTQSQTIVIQAGKTVGVTMKNQPMGQLIIQKRDSITGQPLPGAEFRITTAAGCEVGLDGVIGTSTLTQNGLFTTDSNGEIRISNLVPGAYVLTEIKAPAGYIMDAPSTNVVIGTGGDTQTVVIKNTKKGSLIIEKYDSVTKQPLSGAQFKIMTASGELVADNEGLTSSNGLYTTDADGQIVLFKLLPGAYVVSEVKAPDNYQADPTPQTVVVNAADTKTIRFYDDPLCTLTILKRDAVTKKPLKGAEFTVRDSEGRDIGRYTTGTDGTVTVSGLAPNATIVVSEAKAPTGYIKDETPKNIVVRSGVANSLTFDNEPGTTLVIHKYIEGTENEPLSGVCFKVVDGSGAAIGPDDGCYYTDKAGEIALDGIEPGTTVKVREIKTVEGYVLDGTPQDILIKGGEVQSLTFWNKKAGTLVIQKKDSVTGALIAGAQFQLTYANGGYVDNDNGHLSSNGLYTTDANGEIRISGIIGTVVAKEVQAAPGYVIDSATQTQTVTVNPLDTQTLVFLNEPLCSLTITKLDSVTGKPVPGTMFAVKDGNGNLLGSYTTGADGTVTVTGLVPGSTVVVVETKVPVGYVLDPTPQTIIVENGVGNSITTGAGGNSGNIGSTGNNLTFENNPTVSLTIHKYIEGTANEPLAGVVFKVVDGSGAAVGSGDGVFYTNAAGEIVIEGLEPGAVITAREIKTVDGFVLDGTPKTVKITAGQAAPELTFWNKRAGTLVIQKRDSVSGTLIAGAQFQLTYASGGYVDTANGHLSSNGLYTTDANGEIRISGITGAVVAREVKAAPGYVIDQSTQTQTVTVNPEDTQTLVFLNDPLCSLTITKLDSVTGKPVPGTEFTVKDGDGNLLDRYVTGKDGTVVVTGLIPGSAVVVVESRVPAGYVLDPTPQTIIVKNGTGNSITTGAGGNSGNIGSTGNNLTFENDPTVSLTIHKYIEGTANEPLAGVAFKVVDGSGAPVGPSDGVFYTNAAGEIVIEGLEPGTVITAREIKTVDGFVLDGTPKTVKITAGQAAPELTFWNKRAGTLVIQKRDSVSGALISGAQFQLTYANGGYVDTDNSHLSSNGIYSTNANGEIRISGITGTVVAKEIKPAPGYVIDQSTQTQTAEVRPEDTQVLTFYNQPLCTLVILKQDAVTQKPLKGAELTVKDSNGNLLGSYTTGADGTVTVTDLIPNSTYVVSETKAPAGYINDETPKNIVVRSGVANNLTFENDPTVSLTIHKYIEGTQNEPLAGVAFKIVDGGGAAVGPGDGVFYTNAAGEIVIEGLEPGAVITAREIKTVDGFVLDGTPKTVKITAGQAAPELTFWNKRAGTLVIQKRDSVSGALIAGAQFQLTYANGGYVNNDNGHLSSNGLYSTDANGEIRIPGIIGTLVVKEVKAAPGYVIDQSTQNQTVTVNPEDTQTLVFLNAPLCSLTITKLDSVTGKPVPGTVFAVKDGDGNVLGNYTTGQDGTVTVTGLVPGSTVVVTETKVPAGYVLDPTPQTIIVKNGTGNSVTSGSSSIGNNVGGSSNGNGLTFENDPTMTLTIHKYIEGTTNEPLAGVAFKVVDGSGAAVGPGDGVFYTNAAGEIVINGLEPGTTITAREIKTVDGFVLDGTPKTVKITAGSQAPELTFWNKRAGELVIRKLDSVTKKPLAGVEFELTYAGGGYVDNASGHLSSNGLYTTDTNGEIRISGVIGTIVVTETRTISGYVIDETTRSQTVEVRPEDTQVLTFYNQPLCTLTILKRDAVTQKPLKGAEFTVKDSEGRDIGRYVTGTAGTVTVTGLIPDSTYVVSESKAPTGYITDATPKNIVVRSGIANSLTFDNEPTTTLIIQKYADGTTDPIRGVTFLVTDSSGQVVGPNNGEYVTDRNGRIAITGLTPGTTITVRETKTVDGYVLDATPQSILIKSGTAQTLTFFNKAEGGLELIKVNEADRTQRIPSVAFEIRRMDGGLVETVTTGKDGRVYVTLDAGDYYAVEVQAADGFKLDTIPHYFTVKDGKTTTLTVTNKRYSGILIHKTDSATSKGIQGVTFLLYDSMDRPIGQYVSDDSGYVYIEDLTEEGRYYLKELDNPGYVVDTQPKTVYVKVGETTQIEWQNTPITGQIQIMKTSADYNSINGWPAGSHIPGTVFEIYDWAGNLVDTVQTDKNGVAASKPLPLGRYKVVESQSADFYLLDKTPITAELEFAGQIVRVAMTNRSVSTGVSISKRGYGEVMSGQNLRYTFSSIANTSNVPLTSFFWRDTLPVNAVRLAKITTGTYSAAGSYKVVYRTNLSGEEYRTLADNLSTQRNYMLEASPAALGLASNEYVTEVMFMFGVVPAGFRQVEAPMIDCTVLPGLTNGLQFVNQADVGGVYGGQWVQAVSRWTTKVYAPAKPQTLPRTGY